eukprot:m.233486 g.233486  ORF g.233486 m.233486 type:complete len:256 (+) comp19167_c0_seq1:34-801(+)
MAVNKSEDRERPTKGTRIKVIGLGYGRTGTLSLKMALEELGFGPCYHMTEVLTKPAHVAVWTSFLQQGKQIEWDDLLANYHSAVDFPITTAVEELAAYYPAAKLVLTTREAGSWFESANDTIFALPRDWSASVLSFFIPPARKFYSMIAACYAHAPMNGRLDREGAIANFNAHNERMRTIFPPERVLDFQVKQGWAPLCTFLGVPVPSTPFPNGNDTPEFRRRLHISRALASVLLLLSIGSLVMLFIHAARFLNL